MKKGIENLMWIMGMAVFAGSLFFLRDIPKNALLGEAGGFLLGQSVSLYRDGQGPGRMAAEVLGGQPYFAPGDGDDEKTRQILVENQRQADADNEQGQAAGDTPAGENIETMAGSAGSSGGTGQGAAMVAKLKSSLNTQYLWDHFYIVDSTTSVKKSLFPIKTLLNTDLTLKKETGKIQILIYHTHGASESFADSSGKVEDSIVGVGTELAKELEKRGYGVYHDKTRYDLIDGQLERSLAYNKALEGIEKIRAENPDIRVMIDLHRDSVGKGTHTYTTVNGKKTALVMFFNGMSRNRSGEIDYLYNPNRLYNLAFSLQLKCKAMERYDGLTKPIYLKGYRYNLHLEKRSLLIELGNQNNTVEEAKNAAAPIADILDRVLSGT